MQPLALAPLIQSWRPAPKADGAYIVCFIIFVFLIALLAAGSLVYVIGNRFQNSPLPADKAAAIREQAASDPRLVPLYQRISADRVLTVREWNEFQALNDHNLALDDEARSRQILSR